MRSRTAKPRWNEFQSTLSVRRATNEWRTRAVGVDISIHALRKESDIACTTAIPNNTISIHALRKESDLTRWTQADWQLFQSTLSVRRATGTKTDPLKVKLFQSTLSVRRATHPSAEGV